MSPLMLGCDSASRPLYLPLQTRRSTHMHLIGGSGTGKSKFLEFLIRQDVREGRGLCVLDWHGSLYNDVLRYCALQDVGLPGDFRSVVLLNPSRPDFVTGFNPFAAADSDISVQVSRRVDATVRPWGVTNTDQTPTFARICRLLYTFMIENRQTLPNAATLLHFKNRQLRERAAESIRDRFSRDEWDELQSISKFQDWKTEVLSTKNRPMRFVGSTSIRRFMGLSEGNVDVLRVMDEGGILLVNLGSSEYLDREAARVFASLLINEFFELAMKRGARSLTGEKPRPFTLFLDEFQEYITDDVASMLDQVRKGGLHMVLAHQHLGHFAENERLKEAVFTNARIRAVFGGLSTKGAGILAEEMFLPDLNSRQVKAQYFHTAHRYEEQTRTVRSWSRGTSRGESQSSTASFSGNYEDWDLGEKDEPSRYSESASVGSSMSEQESFSESRVPFLLPIPFEELTSETEWSREEKVSRVAEKLKSQPQRHCFIKVDTAEAQDILVPFIRDFHVSTDDLLEYERSLYRAQGALPAATVDRLLTEGERAFVVELSGGNMQGEPESGNSEDHGFFE